MRRLFPQNLLAVVISAGCCTALSLALNAYGSIYSTFWYIGVIYLALLSFILNLIYARRAGTSEYAQLLMGSIVAKLLAALVAIAIYLFVHREGFYGFSLQFICHYILFTIFEIRYLLHILRNYPIKK